MNDAQPDERQIAGRPVAKLGRREVRVDALPCHSLDDVSARRDSLIRLAYRFCWNIDDAEDAVQNALALAARKRDQLQDRRKIWSWVRAIVVRQCHDLRRRVSREMAPEAIARETATHQTPATGWSDAELAQVIRRLIPTLPEKQQTAIVLRHLENLDYAAIGELMGITESTARVHVRNAREALRRQIVNEYPEWAPPGRESEGQP